MASTGYIVVINKANGLRAADVGVFAKSDPYCVITTPGSGTLKEQTQVVQSNLNPTWDMAVLVPSNLALLEIYDSDKGTFVDGADDFLGRVQLDLAAITGQNRGTWHEKTLGLMGSSSGGKSATGTLTVSVRAYAPMRITVQSASALRNADGWLGKSDPFVRIKGLAGTQTSWGETKTCRDTLEPTWNESFPVDVSNLLPMGGKLDPLILWVADEDDKKRGSADDPLGHAKLPWKHVWPDQPEAISVALEGQGAKGGSKIKLSVQCEAPVVVMGTIVGGGGGGGAAEGITLPKSACKAILTKGFGFKIADCTDKIADNFTLGLAWNVTNGVNIDLDASCVWLDESLQQVDSVWFRQLQSTDGSMRHMGDEREGDAVGDDESIRFDLEDVHPSAKYLCFNINSFTGQELNDVTAAKCRLYNTSTGSELTTFDMASDKRLDCTALLMAVIYRAGQKGEWYMHAAGEPANGRTVNDNVDEWQAFLKRTPLAALHEGGRDMAPKCVNLKVPEVKGPNDTLAFATPGGGLQQVKLPAGAPAGMVITVPVVDIYTA